MNIKAMFQLCNTSSVLADLIVSLGHQYSPPEVVRTQYLHRFSLRYTGILKHLEGNPKSNMSKRIRHIKKTSFFPKIMTQLQILKNFFTPLTSG